MGFPGGSHSKKSAWSAGDTGLIPWWGRSPGEGNGNPLQFPGQRSLAGYSQSIGSQRVRHDLEAEHTHAFPTLSRVVIWVGIISSSGEVRGQREVGGTPWKRLSSERIISEWVLNNSTKNNYRVLMSYMGGSDDWVENQSVDGRWIR